MKAAVSFAQHSKIKTVVSFAQHSTVKLRLLRLLRSTVKFKTVAFFAQQNGGKLWQKEVVFQEVCLEI